VKPARTDKSGLHRYCSACVHETEHLATEEPAIRLGARHNKKVQCDQLAR
jgi:hypothetical protein